MATGQAPRNAIEALDQARKERNAASPEVKLAITANQIADALIGIRWALVGLLEAKRR
jgi:hypothetical protein